MPVEIIVETSVEIIVEIPVEDLVQDPMGDVRKGIVAWPFD